MKTAKVTRYSCDFCRKVAYKSATMKSHESGCTNNPERLCKHCARMGTDQPDNVTLLENAGQVENLRNVANGCPACMLTGVRLFNKTAEDGLFAWIDYKAEHERYWAGITDSEQPKGDS
jgi:hypothetical protein